MPIEYPEVTSGPAPIGPYSIVAEANGFVFVSGQVGFDPATGTTVPGGVEAQADQVMSNIGAILGDVGLGYGDIVKTTIFLADMADFSAVNAVYGRYLGDSHPARSTVQVAGLPGGHLVEIETIAAR
jgi:2-iminobutanoate/2-iminopropanoate deaminase